MTKIRKEQINSGNAPDGYVLTADGSGNSNWEAVTGTSTGGGGGLSSLPIYDNHIFKASGTSLDFMDGLSVDITGTSIFIGSIFGTGTAGFIGAKVTNNATHIYTGTSADIGIPIQFTTESWDTDNIFTISEGTYSTRLTCQSPGKYFISGFVTASPPQNTYSILGIKRSGNFILAQDKNFDVGISTGSINMFVATTLDLDVADYVELVFDTHGSGSQKVFTIYETLIYSPWFMMHKIDPYNNIIVTGTVNINNDYNTYNANNVLPILDDNVFKLTGTAINFNAYLDVVEVGTVAQVDVNIPDGIFASGSHTHPAGSAAISIFEDGVFKATGTAISFNDNLDVSASGTTVFINAIGGSSIQGTTVTITGAFLIDNAIVTPLQWQIEVIDELGFWSVGDSTKMLINATDWYMISCYANWSANTAGTRKLDIINSGTAGVNTIGSNKNTATGGDNTNTVSAIERLVSGSYVYITGLQDSGGQRQVEDCRWSIAKL